MKIPVTVLFLCIFTLIGLSTPLFPGELTVVAEESAYTRTSSYDEVIQFIYQAQKQSPLIQILTLTTSTEGRAIPLLIISLEGIKNPKELSLSGKPAVLFMANIHAGEVEGKEALQLLIREFVNKKAETLRYLEKQVVMIVPIFNPDGNDKFGKNRGDNGPELAGVRYNGQFLDLNRDYLKLESPEVTGLVQLFNQWDPVLIVDLHTTNGSYHQEPVTYATQSNPNGDNSLSQYMWDRFFPGVAEILKKTYGYDSVPYGNFMDFLKPELGWENDSIEAKFGTNYAGLRNRFTILSESYSHADFKTRVLSTFGLIKSILQFSHQHIGTMQEMVKTADRQTATRYFYDPFILEFKSEKLFDITLKSYVFINEPIKPEDRDKYPPWFKDFHVIRTETLKDYRLPYFAKVVPVRTIPLPEAYVILPGHMQVITNLKQHGIVVEKIRATTPYPVEIFTINQIKLSPELYQGHVLLQLKGTYKSQEIPIPENAYFVSMKQPLARLIPLLLEPECLDSLASWGFLNRQLVQQWSKKTNPYPIYRITKMDAPLERFQE